MKQNSKPTDSDESVSEEDRDLFRESVGEVRRVHDCRVPAASSKPLPRPLQFEQDDARVMEELLNHPYDPLDLETGDELGWVRPDMDPRLVRRLRRGKYSVQGEIDLHHLSQADARQLVLDYIAASLADGLGCIKIIHGKGLRSGHHGPRLKLMTNRLLWRHPEVVAYASAAPNDGGTGAVYVLLRHRPRLGT